MYRLRTLSPILFLFGSYCGPVSMEFGGPVVTRGCSLVSRFGVPSAASDADESVTLERTECLGPCPVYRVTVRADGLVSWRGRSSVATTGEQTARIDQRKARELVEGLRTPRFWALCSSYARLITDHPTHIITLQVGGQTKAVRDYASGAPQWLRDYQMKIDEVADTHQWRHGDPKREGFSGAWSFQQDASMPKSGRTELMVAASRGEVERARALLKAGAAVNQTDSSGWTALMYAMPGARMDMVKLLIDAGADPRGRSLTGQTVLMATALGWEQIDEKLSFLIDAGVDINARDDQGMTALMIAAQGGLNSEYLAKYIKRGADPGIWDKQHRTAFDLLPERYGDRAAVRALLERPAK